jgi:hypothetical protein
MPRLAVNGAALAIRWEAVLCLLGVVAIETEIEELQLRVGARDELQGGGLARARIGVQKEDLSLAHGLRERTACCSEVGLRCRKGVSAGGFFTLLGRGAQRVRGGAGSKRGS